MSRALIPSNESELLRAKDIVYRSLIPHYSGLIDLDPMSCDEKLLPYLAQVVQVLYWDNGLTVEEKRKLIKESLELHRHIGTPWAIEKVFSLLDLDAKVFEWFEYETEPYHFKVQLFDLGNQGHSKRRIETFEKMLLTYKNVRSVLDAIEMHMEQSATVQAGSFLAIGEVIEIEPYVKEVDLDFVAPINFYGAIEIIEKITL